MPDHTAQKTEKQHRTNRPCRGGEGSRWEVEREEGGGGGGGREGRCRGDVETWRGSCCPLT